MRDKRNYGLYLAMLAAVGFTASMAPAQVRPAPATQSAAGQSGDVAAAASTQLPTTAPAITTVPVDTSVREIPLDKVWAYQMPGTRPLEMPMTADGKAYATDDGKLLGEILLSLKDFGSDVRGGFAVMGVDSAALVEAHKVLVDNQSVNGTLDRTRRLSVVLFSRQMGLYVNLKKIVQKGASVEISYQFVPRETKDFTPQIAVIPLYDPPPGTLKIILHGEDAPLPLAPVDPHEIAGQVPPPSVVTMCVMN